MQLGNQLWAGKLRLVSKETPLLEYLLTDIPATPEKKWVAKVYMVKSLLQNVWCLTVNKTLLKESRT